MKQSHEIQIIVLELLNNNCTKFNFKTTYYILIAIHSEGLI